MLKKFYKMHGIGNDYIFFDCMEGELENFGELSKRLSDRHFSIGGDGVIALCKSDVADCKMRMFNSDGSEGKMCGNGIRCLGKLAHDLGYVKGDECTVETVSGIKKLEFTLFKDGLVSSVKVNMGKAELDAKKIPSTFSGEKVIAQPLTIGGQTYKVTLVSMGNPHCVIFQDPNSTDVEGVGRLIENDPVFPERVNVEFIRVIHKKHLKMRVWERGSGETLACGTGACAAVVASCLNGYSNKGDEVTVSLLGGDLQITYTDEAVYMTGGAKLVFTGEIEV